MTDTTPAATIRQAAEQIREAAAAMRAEINENRYWHGPGNPTDNYRRGVDCALGGPAGLYASRWTPDVADALDQLLTTIADDMDCDGATLEARPRPGDPDRVVVVHDNGSMLADWTAAWRLARAYLADKAASR